MDRLLVNRHALGGQASLAVRERLAAGSS